MFEALVEVILPAFVVIGLGSLLGQAFKLDIVPVNRVALYAAVPSLIFTSLATTDINFQGASVLLAGNSLFILAMALITWLASWRFGAESRRGLLATSMFSNAANIMLPVSLFAFGDAGLQRALILYVFSAVALFAFGPIVLSGPSRGGGGFRRWRFLLSLLRLPVIWGAALGIAFNLLSIRVPVGLARGIELVGDAAVPLVLLTLGLQIWHTGFRLPSGVNIVGACLKLLVGPLVGYLTARLVGATGLDLAILTLLAAMPPAVNNFMLALEFGGKAEEVARTVILSTFVAAPTLAAVVYLLQRMIGLPG